MFNVFQLCCPFPRKGKTIPFDVVEKDATGQFVNLFTSMGEECGNIDLDVALEFAYRVYGQHKTDDVNEPRNNNKLLR